VSSGSVAVVLAASKNSGSSAFSYLFLVVLIVGAYMLFDYIRRSKASDRIVRFDSRRPPPSVVVNRPVDTTNFRTGETTQFARRDVTPLPFERRS